MHHGNSRPLACPLQWMMHHEKEVDVNITRKGITLYWGVAGCYTPAIFQQCQINLHIEWS